MTADPATPDRLVDRRGALAERAEGLPLPPPPPPPTAPVAAVAFRWRATLAGGRFPPVPRPRRISLADLRGIDRQAEALDRNPHQFARGRVGRKRLGDTG